MNADTPLSVAGDGLNRAVLPTIAMEEAVSGIEICLPDEPQSIRSAGIQQKPARPHGRAGFDCEW